MSCVNTPELVSMPCLLEIIKDIRSGNVSTTTIRKILKQVDCGLAIFNTPEVGVLSSEPLELVDALEDSLADDISTSSPIWLTILIAILRELLKNMPN